MHHYPDPTDLSIQDALAQSVDVDGIAVSVESASNVQLRNELKHLEQSGKACMSAQHSCSL